MNIQLLIIGNEILSGRTHEINGHHLAKYLSENHYTLNKMIVIPDHVETIIEHLNSMKQDADVILISGGLGPTKDDMTKVAFSKCFDKKLVPSKRAKLIVEENYKRFGREWKPELNFYDHFPEDFTPLNNVAGLAPGIFYQDQKSETMIFALPGVPREFKAMFDDPVLPLIKEKYQVSNSDKKKTFTIKTKGIPEEKIFGELCPNLWDTLESYGPLSSLPNLFGVDLVLKLNENNYDQQVEEIKDVVNQCKLSTYVWQYGDQTLPEFLVQKITQTEKTLALAESCTGGMIANEITNVSGSSACFMGSAVTYSNESKMALLGVKEESLIAHGAVSEQVALEMAKGVRKAYNSTYGISITGIAGPGGGSKEKPVGTAYIGMASPLTDKVIKIQINGTREVLKQRFTRHALIILLENIYY